MSKASKNYFPTPNEILSLGLSPGEFVVYSYLLRCADRRTHQCWPSYKTIGAATQMSVNTVCKHVCSLADKGLIGTDDTTVFTKTGLKRNGNLLYTIRPIQLALDQFYEQQLARMDMVADRHRVATTLALRNNSAHST